MYFTPDINNDAHNTDITYAGFWLDEFLSPRLDKIPQGTIILVTWDEDNYLEWNHVFALLLGPEITPGSHDDTEYNHYSITRTIEDNWDLGTLDRHDKDATPFFKPHNPQHQ